MTKELTLEEKRRTLDRAVRLITGLSDAIDQLLAGPSESTKPTESQSTSTGKSTSTKKVIASYVVELTDDGSVYPSITVTPQGPLEGYSALRVTGTSWGISETMRNLSDALLLTWTTRQRSRYWASGSHQTNDE